VLALSVKKINEERMEKRRRKGRKKIDWPYPGWKTFRVDVFRINGLLNKAVLLEEVGSIRYLCCNFVNIG
jgi:hypothetical protein